MTPATLTAVAIPTGSNILQIPELSAEIEPGDPVSQKTIRAIGADFRSAGKVFRVARRIRSRKPAVGSSPADLVLLDMFSTLPAILRRLEAARHSDSVYWVQTEFHMIGSGEVQELGPRELASRIRRLRPKRVLVATLSGDGKMDYRAYQVRSRVRSARRRPSRSRAAP